MEENVKVEARLSGGLIAVLIILLLCGAAGIGVGVCSLITIRDYIAEQKEEENVETMEDYVIIADSYEIKPTTNISEAYISGDTSSLNDKEKETLDMAGEAIAEMEIKDSMSDYEKEKAVYDWMTSALQQDRGALTVIPNTTADCDNPYGVLKYHNAVCVGYATTFRMFMQMMGIDCMVEHNTERYHSWDLVKLDGEWYITDVYSDAGNGNYSHFNMTDDIWGQDQTWDHDYFPSANSLKYNMAYQNRKTVKTVYDLPSALREAMDEKLGTVMVAFEQEITDSDAAVASYVSTTLDDQLMTNSYVDMPYTLSGYKWVQNPDDNKYLYLVTFGTYNVTAEESSTLTEEQMQQVQQNVNESLDGLTAGTGTQGYDYSAAYAEDGTVTEYGTTSDTEVLIKQ